MDNLNGWQIVGLFVLTGVFLIVFALAVGMTPA